MKIDCVAGVASYSEAALNVAIGALVGTMGAMLLKSHHDTYTGIACGYGGLAMSAAMLGIAAVDAARISKLFSDKVSKKSL